MPAMTELYLSRLKEETMTTDTKLSYTCTNLTKEECLALNLLRCIEPLATSLEPCCP